MADERLLALMAMHMRMRFPSGCRGVDIDGVALVLTGAEVYGVATWYDDNDLLLSDRHAAILTREIDRLDRIKSKLPTDEATAYFQLVRDLAAYLLASRGPERPSVGTGS